MIGSEILQYTAQLDVYPTGDREVTDSNSTGSDLEVTDREVRDSNHTGSATFFHQDEIFSTVILSLSLIQEGQLSVSGKRICTILVYHLED